MSSLQPGAPRLHFAQKEQKGPRVPACASWRSLAQVSLTHQPSYISPKGSVNMCSVYSSTNRIVRSWVREDKDRLPSSEQESSRAGPGPEAAVCAQGCDRQGQTAEGVGSRALNPEESEEACMQLSVRCMEHGVGGRKKAAGNQSRRKGRDQIRGRWTGAGASTQAPKSGIEGPALLRTGLPWLIRVQVTVASSEPRP